jgi:hypothetical protein
LTTPALNSAAFFIVATRACKIYGCFSTARSTALGVDGGGGGGGGGGYPIGIATRNKKAGSWGCLFPEGFRAEFPYGCWPLLGVFAYHSTSHCKPVIVLGLMQQGWTLNSLQSSSIHIFSYIS